MKLSLLFAAGALAAPTVKELSKRDLDDIQILNYALTLEHLENAFYRDALVKYGPDDFAALGYGKLFYMNLQEVSRDESTHVDFLTGAIQGLGAKPVEECTYSFPYTTPMGFVAIANILEGVGITAYLGAAKSIMDKTYLTYAGSVLTVESRHSSYLRATGRPRRSPFPQAFDVPLDFNEVYSLASQFIVSCPSTSPSLPLTAFPVLTYMKINHPLVFHGAYFKVQATNVTFTYPIYAFFIYTTGPVEVPSLITDDPSILRIKGPSAASGIAGQSYLVICKEKMVTDDTIIAGPAIVPVKTDYLP